MRQAKPHYSTLEITIHYSRGTATLPALHRT